MGQGALVLSWWAGLTAILDHWKRVCPWVAFGPTAVGMIIERGLGVGGVTEKRAARPLQTVRGTAGCDVGAHQMGQTRGHLVAGQPAKHYLSSFTAIRISALFRGWK